MSRFGVTLKGVMSPPHICLALLALQTLQPLPSRAAVPQSTPITNVLKVHANNHNYFTDGSGQAVYLTGSHTWNDFQDWGTDDSPQPFDFAAYVKMLVAHNHNFTLLWQTELPVFRGYGFCAFASPVTAILSQAQIM